jgi:Cu(I)/Ag(I) efflux system membrane fusion protein/cobalt-zinc-cadmium efflux system membrane fusion protein
MSLLHNRALRAPLAALVLVVGLVALWLAPGVPSARSQDEHAGHDHGAEDSLYQCPMHPQVTSETEGRCPICKMFLKERPRAEALAKKKAWEDKEAAKAASSQPAKKEAAPPPPAAGPKTAKKPRAVQTATAKAAPDGDWTCPMHPQVSKNEWMRCPVCGMDLVPRDKLHEHEGADHDHDTFECPMHPEIVTDEAGSCPICGMDLVMKEKRHARTASARRAVKHWVAPLDPAYTSDGPGKSPQGNDLVPVYVEEGGGPTVGIDPVVVQNMGVRVARAERKPLFRHIRALGTVDVAEDEVAVVNLRFSGWVEHLYVDETGVKVGKGQALAEVYSPELVAAQEEYLLALRTQGADSQLAKSSRRRLTFFGMREADVQKLDESKQTLRTIAVRAPRDGFVLHKNVVLGARVVAGKDLFRIGNLQKIWINAEVYENDAPWVTLDAPATMELTFQQGKVYSGHVAYVYPTLNMKSRTLTVRLEFDNPGLGLKPGMFATVRIEARRKDGALSVPTESIIHSGERQIVFVALGRGRYEKREIVTGLVADRYLTEVIDGVDEGERVVVSGQFLIDSESQLQEAVQKLLDARLESKTPQATGASGDARAAHDHGEADSYFTCPMHPQIVQDGPGSCPICGMDLVEKKR